MTAPATARHYTAHARSTDTFGRVLCNSRDQHLVVDGPIQNGCPGEAITPAELFLAGVAACGVELLQVIAREQSIPLENASVNIAGIVDRANQQRQDVTLFNTVRLRFELKGVSRAQGEMLIDNFRRR
jgi:organic hydroperoxide reductase OsmC/OhrA